jgi:hypothetical protein
VRLMVREILYIRRF